MTYSPEWKAEALKSHGEMLEARVSIRSVTYGTSVNLWNWNVDNVAYPASVGDTGPATASTISSPVSPTGAVTRKLEHYEYGQIEFTVDDEAFKNATTATFSFYIHASTSENYDGGANPYDQLRFGVRNVSQDDSAGVNIDRVDYSGEVKNDFHIPLSNGTWGTVITHWAMHGRENELSATDFWRRFEFTFDWNNNWGEEDDLIFYIHAGGTPGASPYQLIWSSPMIEIDASDDGSGNAGDYFETEDEVTIPGDIYALGDYRDTIGLNAIVRKREREFGVVQGQETQLSVGNVDANKLELSKPGSMIAVEMGFPYQDLWELAAQGTISNVKSTTDLKLFVNFADPIRKIIDSKLDRDTMFGTTTWISEIDDVEVNDASETYSNDNGGLSINALLSANVRDEVYKVKFISDTEFLVYNSQGLPLSDITGDFVETGTIFNTSVDAEFGPRSLSNEANNLITINKDGWTAGSNNYTTDDTFQFTTSYARTLDQLTPLGMVRHLIEDVLNVKVYDVIGGQYYNSPLDDLTSWNTKVSSSEGQVGGFWKAGSKLISMLQDVLILEHATIFPTETGQIGLWVVDEAQPNVTYLNGAPGEDVVNVLSASMLMDDEKFANVINIEYKNLLDGVEKTLAIEAINKDRPRTEMNLSTKWRVQDAACWTCIGRALTRFNYDRKTYEITTPISLISVDLTDPVTITEPFLGLGHDMAEVTERHLNIQDQTIKLVAWNDKLATLTKARIDITRIDQVEENIW